MKCWVAPITSYLVTAAATPLMKGRGTPARADLPHKRLSPAAASPALLPVLPLVQVRGGRVQPDRADPHAVLPRLAAAAGEVVLVDLDGLEDNAPDLGLLREVARRSAVWADAGSREAADVADLFVAGAHRVTVRWSTVEDEGALDEMAELAEPGALYLGLEFRDVLVGNRKAPRLDAPTLLHKARELGLPVVALELAGLEVARSAVAGHPGERWYAAPRPPEAFDALEGEAWTGGIGLPPGRRAPPPTTPAGETP